MGRMQSISKMWVYRRLGFSINPPARCSVVKTYSNTQCFKSLDEPFNESKILIVHKYKCQILFQN